MITFTGLNTMASNDSNFRKLGQLIYKRRPKNSTGIYITSKGVTYGYRTNEKKYPENFIPFNKIVR